MSQVGNPKEVITIEPVVTPIPQKEPVKEPSIPERDKEPVKNNA